MKLAARALILGVLFISEVQVVRARTFDAPSVRETYERLFEETKQEYQRYSLQKQLNPAYLAFSDDRYLTPEYDEVGGFRLSLYGIKLYGPDGNLSGKFATDLGSLATLFRHEFGHLVFRSYLSALDSGLRGVYKRLENYGAWSELAKKRALTVEEQRKRDSDYQVFRSDEYRAQVAFFTKSLTYHEFFADAFAVLTQDREGAVYDLFQIMGDGHFQISSAHSFRNTHLIREIQPDACQGDNRACLGALKPMIWNAYLRKQHALCGGSRCSRDQKLQVAYSVLDRLARTLYEQIRDEDLLYWVVTESRSRAERLEQRLSRVF